MRRSPGVLLAAALSLPLFAIFVATPLDTGAQLWLGVGLVAATLLLSRSARPGVGPLLAVCSVAVSSRYLYWRATRTLEFSTPAAAVCGWLLFGAELYAFAVLILGYFQTIAPLGRKPVPLPADPSSWPTVDVLIPTYNEPVEVVRPTVLAALALDWPQDKLRVHLLDDGRRASMRELAEASGARYVARPDNRHAKAGNLNHALARTGGELIAVFDCDHVPARSFLQLNAGAFLKDERLALIQTPHHFYNADPIERNTRAFRSVPNEGELFYGLIQSGNDFWNASFFCGSCAILRRSALESIGGVQTDSVTEDALTALRLQRQGYSTGYIGIRQSAGLATDTLRAHVGQRIRWAQGMVQILRTDNPLLGRGLGLGQRLCYLGATLHFLYALPRIVFLAAPLAYLLFGLHICRTSAWMLVAYALPHLAIARIVHSRATGRFRHSFWDQVYETVLAFHVLVPTAMALLRPRAGAFKVTAKGERIEGGGIDWRLSRAQAVLLSLLGLGLSFAATRLLLFDEYDAGTVLLNVAWALASMALLGAALAVAWETTQRRAAHRLSVKLRAMVTAPTGHARPAETVDLSMGGARLRLEEPMELPRGAEVAVSIFVGRREHAFEARVEEAAGRELRLRFERLDVEDESRLVRVLFGRPDAWLDWDRGRAPDRPISSWRRVMGIGLGTLGRVLKAERAVAAAAAVALLLGGSGFLLVDAGFHLAPLVDRLREAPRELAGRAAELIASREVDR